MWKSKFLEERIAYALRHADGGTPIGDICRQLWVSVATFRGARQRARSAARRSLCCGVRTRTHGLQIVQYVLRLPIERHICQVTRPV